MQRLLMPLNLATLLVAGAAMARPGDRDDAHPPGPPPEALAACEGLAAGAACSFEAPFGTVEGTCFAPEGRPAACRPAHPPAEGGCDHRLPPEALAACEGQTDGAACSFATPDGGNLQGTCRAPEGRPLACAPEPPPTGR
jgi:hypothetical protein